LPCGFTRGASSANADAASIACGIGSTSTRISRSARSAISSVSAQMAAMG
jgi:hypothetical protein